jgi:hypothetical protein
VELTLQQVVDHLAERVGRPAILEDRFLRLIAYSSHDGPVDDVREASILHRQASPEVSSWLKALGLPHARHPVRVPGNSELHMLPRVCVPVLHKDMLLGHLWFVDADDSMSATEIDFCAGEASELATLLHRENIARVFSSARVTDALQMLLTDSPTAADAAHGLEEDGYICAPEGVVAVVVQGVADESHGPVDIEDCLGQALADCHRLLQRGESLHLVRRDHCILLLAAPDDRDAHLRARVDSVYASARAQVAAAADQGVSLIVGVGSHRAQVDQAAESYREARMAVDAATALPGIGELVHWAELGVDQVVVRLASMGEQPPVVHAGLHRMLSSPEALPLVETLETYLDVAGNARLTAERLNLHRTSLYYRLQRIEELAGTDLKNGLERLALHLALKVARLTGEYAPRHGVRGVDRVQTRPDVAGLARRRAHTSARRLTLITGMPLEDDHRRSGLAESLS